MPQQAKKLTELLEEREQWKHEVGTFFREVRVAHFNTSQAYFATALDISQPYLSQIENGVRTPSSETLNSLRSIVEGAASGDEDEAKAKED